MANVFEIIFRGTGLEALTGALKNKLAALVSVAGAWKAATTAFGDYLDKERGLRTLESGLKQAGVLTDGYREKLVRLANEMEHATGISDDKLLSAFGRLSREGMRPDQVDQFAVALENLAGLMGGDVDQAAAMLGKAMNGSFEMFGRMGIKVKDLDSLFAQLAQRGTNILRDEMDTLEGAMKRVRAAQEDLNHSTVSMGQSILGFLSGGRNQTEYLNDFADGLNVASDVIASVNVQMRETWDSGKSLWEDRGKMLAAFRDGVAGVNSTTEAANRSKQALAEQARAAKESADAAKELGENYDKAADAIDKMVRREQARNDVQLQSDLANIDLQEAQGGMTRDQAAAARDEAQAKATGRKLDIEERAARERRAVAGLAIDQVGGPELAGSRAPQAVADQAAADEELRLIGIRRQTLEAQGQARRINRTNDENKAAEDKAAQDGNETVRRAAAQAARNVETRSITEADAIAAIESAIGRALSNQEQRYKRMTGELQKKMKDLEQRANAERA